MSVSVPLQLHSRPGGPERSPALHLVPFLVSVQARTTGEKEQEGKGCGAVEILAVRGQSPASIPRAGLGAAQEGGWGVIRYTRSQTRVPPLLCSEQPLGWEGGSGSPA